MHCAVMVMIVWLSHLQLELPVQSVPITTKVVGSNPAQTRCTRYNIVINLSVTCGRSVVFSTNKTDGHDITEILLEVA
jgi:hypothetical protein